MQPLVIGLSDPGDPDWVEAGSVAEIERHVLAGRTIVVVPARLGGSDEAAEMAAACVCAWLGARVFRTSRPEQVGQALAMTESLAGRRPPALTRRGLA
ncbi:hypothetical protein [Streptosporangium sp. KLBMP 9127]|nr:hypothetical protein [Streptosporangium sp. KLBMP 9127]